MKRTPPPGKILQASDGFWIAWRDEDALLASGEVNEYRGNPGKVLFDISNIVDACVRVEQMGTRDVSLAPPQGEQAPEAADVCSRDLELGMARFQLVLEHADGEVMTAGAKNRVFDVLGRPQ
jgi:hypothetical protein